MQRIIDSEAIQEQINLLMELKAIAAQREPKPLTGEPCFSALDGPLLRF